MFLLVAWYVFPLAFIIASHTPSASGNLGQQEAAVARAAAEAAMDEARAAQLGVDRGVASHAALDVRLSCSEAK